MYLQYFLQTKRVLTGVLLRKRVLTGVLLRKCQSPEQMVLSIVSASQYFVHTPDEPIPQKGVNTKYLLEPTRERIRAQGIQINQNHNAWVYFFGYVQHMS